jgi:hypothetical protein
MNLLDDDLDWHHWFEWWEAMQNCYGPWQNLGEAVISAKKADG